MLKTIKNWLFIACVGVCFTAKSQIAVSADSIKPLLVGQMIPTYSLSNADGKTVATDALFAQKNTILVFYRGGWCPYCNVHLKEVGEMEQKLVDLGYQIVAVSPDAPEKLKTTEGKDSLHYTLLSDSKTALMQKMGIAFYGPDKYKKMFSDASNGDNTGGVLPAPSVFFVDKMGKVAFSYVDPNYKKRLSGRLLLAIATNLEMPSYDKKEEKTEAAKPTTTPVVTTPKSTQTPVTQDIHAAFEGILSKYVNADGRVNYKGLKKDKADLEAYIKALQADVPATDAAKNTRLAYWINAYNALTLKLIVDNYPLSKITDLDGGKTWDVKRFTFGGKKLSLNDIENNIIRPMGDARIHFAVNCAAKSCPPLFNKAFTADNVDDFLETRTRQFINSSANKLTANELSVSKIFDWYGKDFGNVVNFIAKYAKTKVSKTAKLNFNEYDWRLNE
jgi:peroxiredoxin